MKDFAINANVYYMRTTNKALLRRKVAVHGLEVIAVRSKCSASLLQKLVSENYDRGPSLSKAFAISNAVGVAVDELFLEAKEEESA